MVADGHVSFPLAMAETRWKRAVALHRLLTGPDTEENDVMRRIPAGLLAALALVVTGCGSGGDGGGTPSSPSASPDELGVKFAQCMREHGVDIPDPRPGEGIQLRVGPGISRETVNAALEACREFNPQGNGAAGGNPQNAENIRKFAQCMRDNGVESFPDPSDQGGVVVDGSVAQDPDFDAAREKCQGVLSGGS
jgi:hypothetical protein